MDLLCKFQNKNTFTAFGKANGGIEALDGIDHVHSHHNLLDWVVVGEHSYQSGVTEGDEPEPIFTTIPGWWVLVRLAEDNPFNNQFKPFVEWSSADTTDENPNPRDPTHPQVRFA